MLLLLLFVFLLLICYFVQIRTQNSFLLDNDHNRSSLSNVTLNILSIEHSLCGRYLQFCFNFVAINAKTLTEDFFGARDETCFCGHVVASSNHGFVL